MYSYFAFNQIIFKSIVTVSQHIRTILIAVFLLFSKTLLGQDDIYVVRGYLIDESSGERLTDILVVNESIGSFVYGDERGNYKIKVRKLDKLVFSALGYISISRTLRDSVEKSSYIVIPELSRYNVVIKEVEIQAQREITSISSEINQLTRNYSMYEQFNGSQSSSFSNPISAAYNNSSKREISKRRVNRLKYLARKKILLLELIKRSKLSYTELCSEDERSAFVDELLKYDFRLVFTNHYEMLAYINKECKKWMGEGDDFNVRRRSK